MDAPGVEMSEGVDVSEIVGVGGVMGAFDRGDVGDVVIAMMEWKPRLHSADHQGSQWRKTLYYSQLMMVASGEGLRVMGLRTHEDQFHHVAGALANSRLYQRFQPIGYLDWYWCCCSEQT